MSNIDLLEFLEELDKSFEDCVLMHGIDVSGFEFSLNDETAFITIDIYKENVIFYPNMFSYIEQEMTCYQVIKMLKSIYL